MLRRYDAFNVPTSLGYKNEYFYSTNVGASLTIFFFFNYDNSNFLPNNNII